MAESSVARVTAALATHGLEHVQMREFDERTATAVDAAAAIGTTVERIVKSLVFMAGDQPIMVLASGPNRVDVDKVARIVGQPITRAKADQVRQVTGFAIGGVPPVGHLQPLATYVDRDLLQYDEVWAAAGTPNAVFCIQPATSCASPMASSSDRGERSPREQRRSAARSEAGTTTHELFNVRAPSDALKILLDQLPQGVAAEEIPTRDALDRVLAEDVSSPSDLPTFRRSTMDGFAVRAADTFGATEGLPAYLELVDEVFMGQSPKVALGPGECARIATGGMLPDGADAVVMVEQTQEVGPKTIEALRPVAPGARTSSRSARTCAPGSDRVARHHPAAAGPGRAAGAGHHRGSRCPAAAGGHRLRRRRAGRSRSRHLARARSATSTPTRWPRWSAAAATSRAWRASFLTSTRSCKTLPLRHLRSVTC